MIFLVFIMSATFTEVKAQAPVCGEFEVWKPCSVNCGQPNCAQEPEICEQAPINCTGNTGACLCNGGYIREKINGSCVPVFKCNYTCPINQHYEFCMTAYCQPYCVNPRSRCPGGSSQAIRAALGIRCPLGVGACVCDKGFILDVPGGSCVPLGACNCSQNQTFSNSTVWCCENFKVCNQTQAGCNMKCDLGNGGGCICKKGYILKSQNGPCISTDDCHNNTPKAPSKNSPAVIETTPIPNTTGSTSTLTVASTSTSTTASTPTSTTASTSIPITNVSTSTSAAVSTLIPTTASTLIPITVSPLIPETSSSTLIPTTASTSTPKTTFVPTSTPATIVAAITLEQGATTLAATAPQNNSVLSGSEAFPTTAATSSPSTMIPKSSTIRSISDAPKTNAPFMHCEQNEVFSNDTKWCCLDLPAKNDDNDNSACKEPCSPGGGCICVPGYIRGPHEECIPSENIENEADDKCGCRCSCSRRRVKSSSSSEGRCDNQ